MKITMEEVLLLATHNPPCSRSCDSFASKLPDLASSIGMTSSGSESPALFKDLTPVNARLF